ncbi:nuclear transport factor 2 family protein [Iodobacter arcticus]|uniref:Nuclear transport factor 2 family protein n=1 Tax=Iodobacter arcticus TaxID=590593 RepID=A0ABW2R1H7_9NEIS
MNATETRALLDRYISAYNRMDIPAMLLTVHSDIEFKNISGGVVNATAIGATELRALAEQSISLFSERHQEILSFEYTETHAAVTIAFRAIIARDLPNGLKKDQVLELSGRTDFEFKDGLILKITDIS